MADSHSIRLRGPWQLTPLGQPNQPAAPAGEFKVALPGDWGASLGAQFVGTARYSRRFNCPTNLGPLERVWLVVEGVDARAIVTLNDRPLGEVRGVDAAARFDVTEALLPNNLLVVDVSLDREAFDDPALRGKRAGGPGGLVGEVRLEITATR